jgi:hypothetical protein
MTATIRSLFLLSACALTCACSETPSAAANPTRAAVPALPEAKLTASAPALTATAPAQPSSVLEPSKPAEIKPMAPSAAPSLIDVASPEAASPALVDYDRPISPQEVKIDRFVLSSAVEKREPVDESDVFPSDTAKIFAFVQFANPEAAPFAFRVHWEPAEGPASPYGVKLRVEQAARFRTWSWTAIPREPGKYKAVLRTLDGKELASREFTLEAPAH